MKRILLYMHGGSGNKGCEAIVRSTIGIINNIEQFEIELCSWNIKEDMNAGLDKICTIIPTMQETNKLLNILAAIENKLFKSVYIQYITKYKSFNKTKFNNDISISVGGDNYCYSGGGPICGLHLRHLEKTIKTNILWGCSIGKENLTKKNISNLKKFNFITARESLTYNNLKEVGLEHVYLYPDPAFTLEMEECNLPPNFDNVVGINLSPYAITGELAEKNYINLIDYILKHTDMNVALVPHVNKNRNRDMDCLLKIKSNFADNERIILIDDHENCMQMKYIISKCKFFVGARTHATIAAYSTKVPTIVLGYSIKSQGIGTDIFGKEENYVLSVNEFNTENDVTNLFVKLVDNEMAIRKHYDNFMESYIKKAYAAGQEIFKDH